MTASTPVKLAARNLRKEYPTNRSGETLVAIDSVSFDIRHGEFISIVGPSGCGKSTFLYCVAGLNSYEAGDLLLDGREIRQPGPERAMVFQDPSLLPWRTVMGNVSYGMDMQGRFKGAAAKGRAQEFINLVGLQGFEGSYPYQLSGGMRQRVNLARALATDPDLLLMDEPFGALDAQTREAMQAELLMIWERDRKTVIFITHDIQEAVYLSDRVVVLSTRPAVVRDDVYVDLPRPRDLPVKRTPEFLRLEEHIWQLLQKERQQKA